MMHPTKFSMQLIFSLVVAFVMTACGTTKHESLEEKEFDTENIEQTNVVYFSCDGQLLSAYFHADKVQVQWMGASFLLTQAVSASGSYYLGEKASFYIRGSSAELELRNQEKVMCRLVKVES